MIRIRRFLSSSVAAAALVAALAPLPSAQAQSRDEALPSRAEDCRACYAVVIGVDRADDGWLDRPEVRRQTRDVIAHLEARGFRVTEMTAPSRIDMIHGVERLFRRRGAENGSRLVLYYAGAAIDRDGAQLLAAGDTQRGGAGRRAVGGLPVSYLLELMRISQAAHAVTLLDARLPEDLLGKATAEAPADTAPGTRLFFAGTAEDRGAAERLPEAISGLLDPRGRDADLDRNGRIAGAELATALGKVAAGGHLASEDAAPGLVVAGGGPLSSAKGDGKAIAVAVPSINDISLDKLAADADWRRAEEQDIPAAYQDFRRRHCGENSGAADRRCRAAQTLYNKAREQIRVTETDCDRLAGDPFDPDRTGDGVEASGIQSDRAIAACKRMLLGNPEVARLLYLYGRALDAGDRNLEAAFFYREAAKRESAAAFYGLAGVLAKGVGGLQKDVAKAIELIGLSAKREYPPAQIAYGQLLMRGGQVTKDRSGGIRMLERAGRVMPKSYLVLGQLIERQPSGVDELQKALGYYRQASAAGVPGADRAMRRLEDKLKPKGPTAREKVALCERQLNFDVLDVAKLVDLTSIEKPDDIFEARMDRVLARIDKAAAVRACEVARNESSAPASMLARYAMLSNQLTERRLDFGQSDDGGLRDAKLAAEKGDAKGQYLYGILLMSEAADDRRGRGAEDAARWLNEAWRSGVDDAGLLLALMHLDKSWDRKSGFTRRPNLAVDIFERLERKDVPLATFLLGAARVSPEALGLPARYRDVAGGRRLLERAIRLGFNDK